MMKVVFLILASVGIATNSYGLQYSLGDSLKLDTILQLSEVVITANRQMSRKFDRPESISILNKIKLSLLGLSTSSEAISYIPGIWMQKTNHGGGSPFIRGLTGYQTLILIDGIRFNNSTFRSGPNQYLNTIDPYTIDRIEVMRGGGAVQYGSDAIGGTINIITKAPSFTNSSKLIIGGLQGRLMSDNMEYGGRSNLEFSGPKMWIHAGVSVKKFGNIHAGGSLGELDPTGYQEYSADFKSVHKIGSESLLVAGFQYFRQSEVPLYHKIISGDFHTYLFDPQQRTLSYLKLNKSFSSKIFQDVNWMVSYQESNEYRIKQRNSQSDLIRDHDAVHTFGGSVEVVSQPAKFWNISTAMEMYYDQINSKTVVKDEFTNAEATIRGLYPNNSKYENYAISTLHSFGLPPFSISAGLRYNYIHLQVEDPLFGNSSLNPSALIGNLGLVYHLNPNINLVTSLGSGFRSPNINDVSSLGIADFRYEIPNYNLSPEKSHHLDAGIKSQFERSEFSLQGYIIKLNGLITNEPFNYLGNDTLEGLQVYRRDNINEAILKGFEIEGNIQLSKKWSVFGNLAYTHGENISKNEPMRRIPPFNGRLGILCSIYQNLQFRADWIFAGSQSRLSNDDISDDRISAGGTPGWQIVNLVSSLKLGNYRINLGLQNIFDQAYRVHGSGIDGLGRNMWISVRGNVFKFKGKD